MQSKNKNKPGKVGGTPKTVGGTPKTVCRSSQKVGGTPKKVCGASKKVGGTPKTVCGSSQKVGGTPKKVCAVPKKVGGASKTVGGTPKTVSGTQSNVTQSNFEIGRMYCVTTEQDSKDALKVSGFCENKFNDRLILKTSSNKQPSNDLSIEYVNITCYKLIDNASIKYINHHFKNYLDNGIITYEEKSDCCYKNIKFDFYVTQYHKNDEFAKKVDKAFPDYNNGGNGPKIEDCIKKSLSDRIKNPCKYNWFSYESNILSLLNYIKDKYPNKFKSATNNEEQNNQIIFKKLMTLHHYLVEQSK